jgi:hypothetical protein
MEVSGELQVPAFLPLRKASFVPIEYEAEHYGKENMFAPP